MPRAATRYSRQRKPTSPKRHRAPPASGPIKKDLLQRLSSKRLAQPLHDSDDSDKLVVKGPGSRTGGYLQKNEIYASGGVANGDRPGSHPTRAQRRKQMIQATQVQQRAEPTPAASSRTTRPDQTQSAKTREGRVIPTTTSPASIIRPATAQPTPSRDNSILDGIRPRRRQHSILRAPETEDSGLGLADDSFALPDDESTPLNAAKAKATNATPPTSKLPSSASRKRKLGSVEPLASVQQVKTAASVIPTPEPTLPPQTLSTLRASGQRQRPKADGEDDSIMAPPMSSSSSNSPTKPTSYSSGKPRRSSQQPAIILTEQLQALMPLKRRKTARSRAAAHPEFDIPEDSDSPARNTSEPDQDSSFLPTRRKAKKSRPQEKDKDQIDSRTGATKSKQKKSRAKPAQTKQLNKSTRLTPSRSPGNQGTKSPSQHSTAARTRSLSSHPNGGNVAASSSRAKRSGGSPLKVSMVDIEEKENLGEAGETSDVLVARSDDQSEQVGRTKPSPPKKVRSKWDEIDAWDMEFEEVEVWERSSEKDAR